MRSVSVAKAKTAGLDVDGKSAYVCEEHYKQFKKGNKKSDQIEKWRYGHLTAELGARLQVLRDR